jgi:hypothetical protein
VEVRNGAPSQLKIYAMTVSRGREFLSIPGPTNIPDAVLAAMHRPAIDIYAGDMLAVTHSLLENLPKIFRTTGRTYIYAAYRARDQGHSRRPDRYRVGCGERPRGDPSRDRVRRAPRAADGGLRRVARLHSVRDG